MAKGRSSDPLALDPDGIAFHQVLTFAHEPFSLGDALQRSPLFTVEIRKRCAFGEWIRYSTEHEASFFPFGRISVHSHGVLLETVTEERMDDLRRRVNDLGLWKITADQTRVFPLEVAIENPPGLLQPIQEMDEHMLDERDVAATFLRMAWPFFPRPDLDGRAPHAVIRTGRGRKALEELLEGLPVELRSQFPVLPEFEVEELRSILLPAQAKKVEEVPEERPHPADDRHTP